MADTSYHHTFPEDELDRLFPSGVLDAIAILRPALVFGLHPAEHYRADCYPPIYGEYLDWLDGARINVADIAIVRRHDCSGNLLEWTAAPEIWEGLYDGALESVEIIFPSKSVATLFKLRWL
jgi:hypothetical protein